MPKFTSARGIRRQLGKATKKLGKITRGLDGTERGPLSRKDLLALNRDAWAEQATRLDTALVAVLTGRPFPGTPRREEDRQTLAAWSPEVGMREIDHSQLLFNVADHARVAQTSPIMILWLASGGGLAGRVETALKALPDGAFGPSVEERQKTGERLLAEQAAVEASIGELQKAWATEVGPGVAIDALDED